MKRKFHQRGFTLVEVVVALFIVATALSALMFQLSTQLDGVYRLERQTIASWVAQNQLARLQLQANLGIVPSFAESQGESMMGDEEWRWRLSQEATPINGFRRFTVVVSSSQEPEDILVSLTTYLSTTTNQNTLGNTLIASSK